MFFRNFSKDSHIFFLNLFCPLRTDFKTSFVKISKFLKNLKLSKKFRTIFFSEIFRYFEVCSRGDLVVFLGLCSSGDLERISEIGHFKAKKTCFLEIYHNILDLFFWMFRVPLAQVLRHRLLKSQYIDGRTDGRVFLGQKVEKKHVIKKFLKNYSIFFPSCFASP